MKALLRLITLLYSMNRDIAAIVLYNEKNEILLQFRDNNAPTLKNMWGFFGGKVENNETPYNAVIRETKEELTYDLKNLKLIIIDQYDYKQFKGKIFIFIKKYNKTKKLIQNEGENMKFVSFTDIDNLNLIEMDKNLMKQIRKHIV